MSLFPTPGSLRSDPVLSKMIAGLMNAKDSYLQDKLVPTLFDGSNLADGDETYYTGTIQRLADGAMFGDPSRKRTIGRGELYPRARGANFNPMTYACQKFGGVAEVFWEDSRRLVGGGLLTNATVQLQSEMSTQKLVREAAYRDLFQTAGNWTNTVIGVPAAPGVGQFLCWNVANSDPSADIVAALGTVSLFGQEPNTIILGYDSFDALRTNAAFLNFDDIRLDRTVMNEERVASVLKARYGFENVHIGKAVANASAAPGTLTPGRIWADTVWIGYMPSANGAPSSNISIMEGSDVMVTTPTAAGRVIASGWKVFEFPDDMRDVTLYKVRYAEALFAVSAQLGYTLTNTNN